MYLIVDPNVLYLPQLDTVTETQVNRLVRWLKEWDEASRNYDIEFGITVNCKKALEAEARSALNIVTLREMILRFIRLNNAEVALAFLPFLEGLLDRSPLDVLLQRLQTDAFTLYMDSVCVLPDEYLSRLATLPIQESFREMLGMIVFARQNKILPFAELEEIGVLTTFEESEISSWAEATEYTVLVHINYDWSVSETITDWQTIERKTMLNDEFRVVHSVKDLESLANRKNLKTVDEALEAAVARYPRRFIVTRKAEKNAAKSGYQSPQKIYKAVKGLVETWLTEYEKDGNIERANEIYQREIGFEISNESEMIERDPDLRALREVLYDGTELYIERHVKLGRGPNAARIYFDVRQEEEHNKILLGHVGLHPKTSNRRN